MVTVVSLEYVFQDSFHFGEKANKTLAKATTSWLNSGSDVGKNQNNATVKLKKKEGCTQALTFASFGRGHGRQPLSQFF